MNLNFLSGLSLLFIGLQLCGVIAWSWVWILLPLFLNFVLTYYKLLLFNRLCNIIYDLCVDWKKSQDNKPTLH